MKSRWFKSTPRKVQRRKRFYILCVAVFFIFLISQNNKKHAPKVRKTLCVSKVCIDNTCIENTKNKRLVSMEVEHNIDKKEGLIVKFVNLGKKCE